MEAHANGGEVGIRLVVASACQLYCEGLERVFREASGIRVLGTANNAALRSAPCAKLMMWSTP